MDSRLDVVLLLLLLLTVDHEIHESERYCTFVGQHGEDLALEFGWRYPDVLAQAWRTRRWKRKGSTEFTAGLLRMGKAYVHNCI